MTPWDAVTPPVALILAAGQGLRLAPLTSDRPKALVEIRGRTLLERALEALHEAGFARAVVVTGYRADRIEELLASRDWGLSVETCFNPAYATANNIVSFLAAADLARGGFCLLNSDVVFDASIAGDLAGVDPGCWLVVDSDEPLGHEEMKVELDEHGALRRINKALAPDVCAGEYIGIARFDAPYAMTVVEAARELVEAGATHLYYEDAFGRAASRLTIRTLPTRGRAWTEIDDHTDHARAVEIAARLDAVRAA